VSLALSTVLVLVFFVFMTPQGWGHEAIGMGAAGSVWALRKAGVALKVMR